MAPFLTLLKNITPAKITYVIKVRCIRAYTVHFNGGERDVTSIEFIVHDREGTKIHASIPRTLLKKFGSSIKEGQLLLIQNFFVRPNQMRYKTANHLFRIVMYPKTQIESLLETSLDYDFPTFSYAFKKFEEIAGIDDVNETPLFDIIGVVTKCGSLTEQSNTKLLELILEDEEHNKLYCTLWEEYVDVFMQQLDGKDKKLPIVVVRFCRPINYKGEVRACTVYNASEVLLNKDIEEVRQFRERILSDASFIQDNGLLVDGMGCGGILDEFKGGRISLKRIDELVCIELLANFYGQDGVYWICGRIESVDCPAVGWFYMACRRCAKKVDMVKSRFYCDRCNKYDQIAARRYMFIVNVFDGSGNAALLMWDRESSQLLGKKASELNVSPNAVGKNDVIGPEIENSLIGQVVLFKIQLRNESEFRKDRPYTVNKICNVPHIVSQYTIGFFDADTLDGKGDTSNSSFYEDCESLSQITDLSSFDGMQKTSEYNFASPKSLQKTLLPDYDEVSAMNSVKRCLDEDFSSDSGKKPKVDVEDDDDKDQGGQGSG